MPGNLDVRSPSVSTTGYADGLGRRSIRFDREAGAALECLQLRPELAAFEHALRAQLSTLAALDDERFARVRSIERDGSRVTVTSELLTGDRLSDIIEARSMGDAAVSGIDAAFGFLVQILPALSRLHAAGAVHGAIAPGRLILTNHARIVLGDTIYGTVLPRLQLSRHRLWQEFQIAAPPSAGPVRFDATADVAQASLCGLMLVLGRSIESADPVEGLPALVAEAVEVAQIRGGDQLAESVRRFFAGTLPLAGLRTGATADQAAQDAQLIASTALGEDACLGALAEFLRYDAPAPPVPQPRPAAVVKVEPPPAPEAVEPRLEDEPEPEEEMLDAALEAVSEPAPEPEPVHTEAALAVVIEEERVIVDERVDERMDEREPALPSEPERWLAPEPVPEPEIAQPVAEDGTAVARYADQDPWTWKPAAVAQPTPVAQPEPVRQPEPAPRAEPEPQIQIAARAPVEAPLMPPPPAAPVFEPRIEAFTPEPPPVAAAPAVVPLIDEPPAAFVPATPLPPPVHFPPPAATGPVRAIGFSPNPHVFAPPPAPPPQPRFAPPAAPAVSAPAPQAPAFAQPAPLRLKQEPPPSFAPPRAAYTPPPMDYRQGPQRAAGESSGFPTKLAAAVVLVAVIGILGGQYLRQKESEPAAGTRPVATKPTKPSPATPTAAAAPKAASVATTGGLTITSIPSGARVLLDGTHAGETPLRLDGIPAGRHTITLATDSTTVKQTVRIEAGKSLVLDVPVFSGWVAIYAPIVLDVSEGGRGLGSTENGRLLLSPGRHVLTVSNRKLGYSSTHTVEIGAGEEARLNLTPTGSVNLNAHPWAEVWIDGNKAGETPIANLEVPLGTREFVFRHPEHGERKITTTVSATPTALTVDFTKPAPIR